MSWLMQIVKIENKGREAQRTGVPLADNPYTEARNNLQRQRRAAWERGWKLAQEGDE